MNNFFKCVSRIYSGNGTFRYFCGQYTSKEIARPLAPTQDLLFTNFKHATSTKSVLELVSQYHDSMNSKHIMQALRSLFSLQKEGRSDISTKDIMKHRDFHKLCKHLKRQAGLIDIHETIEALKVVTYVGIPSDSTIIQVLLQLIKQNINDLNLQNIMFLEFLLNHYKKSPLVDALKLALPMLFEMHLPTKIEKDNITALTDYLFFASRTNLSDRSIDLIVQAMYRCRSSGDLKEAKSVIWSLTDVAPKPIFELLVKKNIDEMMIHMEEMSFVDLETTLSKLSNAYSRDAQFFYHNVFCDLFVNYIIDHDMGYKNAIYTLRKFKKFGHTNNYLMDYVANKICENPKYITQGDFMDTYHFLTSLSLIEYRPKNWSLIKSLVAESENIAKNPGREVNWLNFGSSLCLLGIFREDLLKKCLNTDLEYILCKRKHYRDFRMYFSIYHSIRLYKPEFSYLLPTYLKPETLVKNIPRIPDFPLEESLKCAYGGDGYVKTNLVSKLGLQIDHAIIFRKEGFPVAVQDQIEFVEDLISEENHLVLITCLRPIHYTSRLDNKLKSSTSFFQKLLQDCPGVTLVSICLESWEALADFEKIPYLTQNIKNSLDNNILEEKYIM